MLADACRRDIDMLRTAVRCAFVRRAFGICAAGFERMRKL